MVGGRVGLILMAHEHLNHGLALALGQFGGRQHNDISRLEQRVAAIGQQGFSKGSIGRLHLPRPSQAVATQGIEPLHDLTHRCRVTPSLHELATEGLSTLRCFATGSQQQHQANHQYRQSFHFFTSGNMD